MTRPPASRPEQAAYSSQVPLRRRLALPRLGHTTATARNHAPPLRSPPDPWLADEFRAPRIVQLASHLRASPNARLASRPPPARTIWTSVGAWLAVPEHGARTVDPGRRTRRPPRSWLALPPATTHTSPGAHSPYSSHNRLGGHDSPGSSAARLLRDPPTSRLAHGYRSAAGQRLAHWIWGATASQLAEGIGATSWYWLAQLDWVPRTV